MIVSITKCFKTNLQDDVNGKIKGVNNILEVLNTMIPRDTVKEIKKEIKKTVINDHTIST